MERGKKGLFFKLWDGYELKTEDGNMKIIKQHLNQDDGVDIYKCIFYNNQSGFERKICGTIDVINMEIEKKVDSIEYYGYLLVR